MNALVIEDKSARNNHSHIIRGLSIVDSVKIQSDNYDSLPGIIDYTEIDLLIIDIAYTGREGYEIASKIRAHKINIAILLIAPKDELYSVMEAARLYHSAYILFPYIKSDLEFAISTAITFTVQVAKSIQVRTFGHFEVFVNDEPVIFKSAKAKELLALLIDRSGGIVTSEQAITTLWENREVDSASRSLYSKVSSSLKATLTQYRISDMIRAYRGSLSINHETFDCDLYSLLKGDKKAKLQYFGQYLIDYSWAEYRIHRLDQISNYQFED